MQKTQIPNLIFMAPGPAPPNAADLLASSRLMSLLSVGQDVFDLVVIDSPPVMGLADTQLLANTIAATVFIVRSAGARKANVRDSLKRLRFARAKIVGAILTVPSREAPAAPSAAIC
jgi:Mrp family chromosome partitioning ATPase